MELSNAASVAAICLLSECESTGECRCADTSCDTPIAHEKLLPFTSYRTSLASDDESTWRDPFRGFADKWLTRELPLTHPVRAHRLLLALVSAPFTWLERHVAIMLSGESPHILVAFSPVVALSSLLYVLVAFAFWSHNCPTLAATFTLVTISSLFTDSLHTRSRFWPRVDRFLATVAAFLGPGRALLLYASSTWQQWEIVLLCALSFACLAWSRQSRCQRDFVIRHTAWHVVSAASLVHLAHAVEFKGAAMESGM